MPVRNHVHLNDQMYHVYNKTNDSRSVFNTIDEYSRFINLAKYYKSTQAMLRYSQFIESDRTELRNKMIELVKPEFYKVSILGYAIMPTHYHFLLIQKKDNGISDFISNITNAYTRYFNTKNKRIGPIFLPVFKSKLVFGDIESKHVLRYIHLNQNSAGIINNIHQIKDYIYNSFFEYFNDKHNLIDNTFIRDLFNTKEEFVNFTLDYADYQKSLQESKYT